MLELEVGSDGNFWTTFAQDYWEREPTVLNAEKVVAPFTLATVFDVVCQRGSLERADRFWAQQSDDGGNAVVHPLRWPILKPTESDGDFAGYFERLKGLCFGANVQNLECEEPAFAEVLDWLTTDLQALLDPQPLVWRTDVFFGNYPLTPFGIHRDPAGVLSIALSGTRRYHFWAPDCFLADDQDLFTPNEAVVAAHLDAAETLTITAGQAVYWPSNRWHIVSSDSAPFVSVQVSAYFAT